jgi:hypothetical protein
MRRYILPLVVFAAIGAVIIILVKSGEESPPPDRDPVVKGPPPKQQGTDDPFPLERRATRTPLERHKWLSELERALGREDLSHAHYFRGKVCEDLDTILADEELTQNLLHAIRVHGVESDDPKRRDVVLPILRVFRNAEATQIIANQYYQAKTPQERMMLLEAMSHEYHDPKQAAVWAVERALNADTAEHRDRAFEVIEYFSNDPELIVDTAQQIYDSTTRPAQKVEMVDAISGQSLVEESAVKWLRKQLRNPRSGEIASVIDKIDGWGDEEDAAILENLALEFPAMADFMRDRARAVRRTAARRAGREFEPEGGRPKEEEPPPDDERRDGR